MAKTKDVLQQKQKKLVDCKTHQEIEEYQSQLDETKAGLKDTQKKNERIIKNFNALLDVGDE